MIRPFVRNILAILLAGVLIGTTSTALFSQDRSFAYTYQSNILPKGSMDLELTNTLRTGKEGEYSPFEFGRILDQRIEFEVGLSDNLQTAFYFNASSSAFALEGGPGIEHDLDVSFSNEWKWKLSDPSVDAIGSALYGELTVSADEIELEGKVILDKRFGDELVALNLIGEYELESEFEAEESEVETEAETPVEIDLSYMHFFSPSFGIGLEARNHNKITEDEGWEHSALFAGPVIFVVHDRIFGILTALPQIANLHKTDTAPGNLVLDDHEKVELRLLVGISL